MPDFALAILAGVLGALFLRLFYATIQDEWPENYSVARNAIDSNLRTHALRYAAFRTVPLYVIGIVVATLIARRDGLATLALVSLAVTHLAATDGRAILQLLIRGHRGPRFSVLLCFHSVIVILGLGAISISRFTFYFWDDLIPRSNDLVAALWTGLFAAILSLSLVRGTRFSSDFHRTLVTAPEGVGTELWAYCATSARKHNCDIDLIRAIVAAESIQRPRWMRRMERMKARFIGPGSYGVAQIMSSVTLTDKQSIDKLCSNYENFYPERNPRTDTVIRQRLAARLEEHNRNPEFVEQVMDFHSSLQPVVLYQSKGVGRDQRPKIEVTEILRRDNRWLVNGTFFGQCGEKLIPQPREYEVEVTGATDLGRTTWRLEVALELRSFVLSVETLTKTQPDDSTEKYVVVDLLDP